MKKNAELKNGYQNEIIQRIQNPKTTVRFEPVTSWG